MQKKEIDKLLKDRIFQKLVDEYKKKIKRQAKDIDKQQKDFYKFMEKIQKDRKKFEKQLAQFKRWRCLNKYRDITLSLIRNIVIIICDN